LFFVSFLFSDVLHCSTTVGYIQLSIGGGLSVFVYLSAECPASSVHRPGPL